MYKIGVSITSKKKEKEMYKSEMKEDLASQDVMSCGLYKVNQIKCIISISSIYRIFYSSNSEFECIFMRNKNTF